MAEQATGSQSSVHLVAERLRRRILSGEAAPGQSISEVGLAQEFGVSRPTLREAMQTLTQEGYVLRERRRRARVSTMTPDALRELAKVRVPLEIIAVRSFLSNFALTAGDLLNERVADLKTAIEEPNVLEVHMTHIALHDIFYRLSGNAFLHRVWSGVMKPQVDLALAADLRVRPDLARMVQAHEDLVVALQGEPEQVEAAVTAHVMGSVEELVPLLNG